MRKGKGKLWLKALFMLMAFAAVTAIVMLLWNALIPNLTGWGYLTYWEAAGLIILCRLLLGGIGHMHSGLMMHHAHKYGPMHDKLMKMRPEERREYIRRRMCGMDDTTPSAEEQ